MLRSAAPFLIAVLVVPAAPSAAQYGPGPDPEPAPGWARDLGVAGVNALAGGLSAALVAWIRDGDPARAFAGGALGGGVVFAGKRLAAQPFDGAGFLGREVAAFGSSLVAGAGAGREWLDEVWLPVGPAWIRVGKVAPPALRLNVRDAAVLAWAATRRELEVDWGATLSNGTAYLNAPSHGLRVNGDGAWGVALGTTVLVAATGVGREETRAHEMIHVIQDDFLTSVWSRPLESWGWGRIASGRLPLELGVVSILRGLEPMRDLEETEAGILARR